MTDSIRSARLTFVDFMGVFLPGAVWTLLLLTALEMARSDAGVAPPTPAAVAASIAAAQLSTGMLSVILVLSLLLGYGVKAVSSKPVEFLANPDLWPKKLRGNLVEGDFFPYGAFHEMRDYFPRIKGYLNEQLGCSYKQVPGYQPFELCKRFLKLRASPLWEEVQEEEAIVRFLGSLFLAALTSTLMSLVALELFGAMPSVLLWLFSSGAALIGLGRTFRNRRRGEVVEVYMSTLLTLALLEERGSRPTQP